MSSQIPRNTTPKIIHFLWLDFKNNADGVLDDTLEFFRKRIQLLHPVDNGWQINFISKWDDCIDSIANEPWLKRLLNNKYVGPAHKSDALRYYYLYTMGGGWIDISTFLVSPLDDLVKQDEDGFTCYYMPSDVCASWLIKMSSDIFEGITMKKYINVVVPIQKKLINIKNSLFDFIPENYFLISSKENEVCKDVLVQLETFWTTALPNINSEDDNCFQLNNYMFELFTKVFTISELSNLKLAEYLPEVKDVILKQYFDCAYFFNYLQLYLAILSYSTVNNGVLNNKINSEQKDKTMKLQKLDRFSKELCETENCNDKVISFEKNPNKNIHLLSASYARLTKWSDSRINRISWEDTLAGDILEENKSAEDVLRKLQEIEITQLKYSSYTRNKSKSIAKLKELFQKGGGSFSLNKIKQKKPIKLKNKFSKKTYIKHRSSTRENLLINKKYVKRPSTRKRKSKNT